MEVRLSCMILTLLCTLLTAAKEEIKNCKPAYIHKQARRTIYFQENGEAKLQCVARGDEPLKYMWIKDGQELNTTAKENQERMTVESGIGSLVLLPVLESDAGVYQCKVQNPCGISLSQKTNLLNAYIEPFQKKPEPDQISAQEGKPLKLSCTPPVSVPEAIISWILASGGEEDDGMDYIPEDDDEDSENILNKVELDERVTMDYDGNLYFANVKEDDEQNQRHYVCMAANNKVRSFNQGEDKIITVIDVYEGEGQNIPTVLQWNSQTNVLALEGRRAKFKCIFSGKPTPRVHWKRIDGGPVDDDRMVHDKHEWIINNVQREDAGTYECSGENGGNGLTREVIKKEFTLEVESSPRWLTPMKDVSASVEDNVTFVCDASGTPDPQIQWYINGVPEKDAPRTADRRLRNNALVFTNVTQDDSQVIQCNASNTHGYLWADIYLKVEAMQPAIKTEPLEQKVVENTDITIPCEVEGKPRPKVVWYKESQILEGSRYQILPNGDLRIMNVGIRDKSFNYKCVATNRFGTAEAVGALIVRRKTEIQRPPSDETLNFGESLIFMCSAVTDEAEKFKLRYIWKKDGKELDTSDPRIKVTGEMLTINATTSKDTGKYTCTATNGLDSDEAEATVQVKAPPEPPYNVSVESCGAVDVHLKWKFLDEQSNFSPLQEFIVEYFTTHDQEWKTAGRVNNSKSDLVYKMSPWASYTFQVRARNRMGLSEPSEPTKPVCKSAVSRPLKNPENVRTVGDKTGWLVIEWEPMPKMEHNAEGFHYVVTWEGEDGEEHSKEIHDWRQNRHEVEVDGIFQPYTVSVKAINSVGGAIIPPQPVTGRSGEAAPSVVPENFEVDPDINVTATSAGFRWDPVDTSPENMNGVFQGYKVRYWKKGQMDSTLHEELIIIPDSRGRRSTSNTSGDNKIRGKVSQLPSFSDIEADVVVVNTHFSSNGSNVVNFSTPEGVPSRVDYLEALFRGSAHFLLEWGQPVEQNGILTGYELGYQKIVGLRFENMTIYRDDIPPSQQRANIDGLDSNSLYRIYIAAKTKMGTGQKYVIDVRTTGNNSELAEPRIEKVHAGTNQANITFSLSQSEKGQRTGSYYYLEYRKIGAPVWDRDNEGATEHFWLTLDELEPATAYEVRVVSVPKSGESSSRSSPEAHFNTADFGAKKDSVLSAGWFIGMMVAIAILLLILIIVCIVKRNRGKEYKFPPEKDTVDETPGHFNEMAKSDKNGVNSSASFERDPEKVPLEDETDSLEDYGDVDPTKFNEDGSFIGQYGDTKPDTPNPSAVSSIV